MQVVDLAQFSGNDADYIDDITGDGGVLKDVLKPGAGDELGPYPPVPSRVKVRHTTTVDDAGDCEAGDRGLWRMGAATNITDERSCLVHCLERCERCHYVSVSRRNADCSWYAFCDLKRLHLEFHGDSYRTFRTGREEGC